jgi:hypothetical protein
MGAVAGGDPDFSAGAARTCKTGSAAAIARAITRKTLRIAKPSQDETTDGIVLG